MKINLKGEKIECIIKKSKRAKRMWLSVSCNAEIIITIPRRMDKTAAGEFIQEKANWILRKINFYKNSSISLPSEKYEDCKVRVHKFIKDRVDYYNEFYKFEYNDIFIKNHRHRWGSCSAKKNLNFNYRLMFLPLRLADYIIVHEICHLKEMNHSRRFWKLVEKQFSKHGLLRQELKKIIF